MVEKARSKKVYNELFVSDILEFLKKSDLKKYSKVLAFDVFPYLGDLREVLKALKGCDVWFSIEENDIDLKKAYVLHSNGRYKHSLSYIKELKKELGYKHIEDYHIVLRKEKDQPVYGFLINLK